MHATEHSCAGSDLLLRYVMVETLRSSHRLGNSGFRCPSASFELERTVLNIPTCFIALCCAVLMDKTWLSQAQGFTSTEETVQRADLSGLLADSSLKKKKKLKIV